MNVSPLFSGSDTVSAKKSSQVSFCSNSFQGTAVSLTPEQRLDLLRLSRTENVGPISFFHLLKRYKSATIALERLPKNSGKPLLVPSLDSIKREVEEHNKRNIYLISYYDDHYPALLRTLRDPPPFLSMKGRLELLQKVSFSIVGARQASQASQRLCENISQTLGQQQWVLTSGLAKGIDGCVHKIGLQESGTIAVVAGGIGHIYPPEHKKLYEIIEQEGLVISEDPLNQKFSAPLFPKRNRLISGLSWGTLIMEASLRSGSLLTARYAADQGRSVFAVPGHPMDFRARGTNKLLKDGACLVEEGEDILLEYRNSHQHLAEETEVFNREDTPWWQYGALETAARENYNNSWNNEIFLGHPPEGDTSNVFEDSVSGGWENNCTKHFPNTATDETNGLSYGPAPMQFCKSQNAAKEHPPIPPFFHGLSETYAPGAEDLCAPSSTLDVYEKVRQTLTTAPIPISAVAHSLGLSVALVRGTLVALELKGEVEFYPGDQVVGTGNSF